MSGKSISLMLIGIILSGCIGYGIGQVYSPNFVNEILPNNIRVKYDELYQQYLNLSSNYETIIFEKEGLKEEINGLESQLVDYKEKNNDLDKAHQNLMKDYDGLNKAFIALKEEKESLAKVLNETQENYESLLMQYQIITGSAPITPQSPLNGTLRRDFVWVYVGKTWTMSLYIPQQLYNYFSNKTRVPTEDYSVYVTHPYDDEYISSIIRKFNEIAIEEGYNENQNVNLVLSFVQSLPYATDDVTTDFDEYPRYPIETLIQGGGDCEDTSILASAILDGMGYNVVLIYLPDHMAVGVSLDAFGTYWLHEESKYFYVETTGQGWEIGELPDAHKGQSAQIYPILPVPVCTHNWSGSTLRHKLTLVTDITNLGTAEARGFKLFVAYEGEDGVFWNAVESAFFDLGVGEETTIVLELNEPRNFHTRIVVRVLDPWGNIMDESYSEWFDTN
jgi:hypothetical protein